MKLLILIPFCALVLGCSSKPDSGDVHEALSKDLVSQCKFATVDNVELDEVIQPDSSNSNHVLIKYSYDLGVKVVGDYVEDFNRWKRAQEVKNQLQEADSQPTDAKVALMKWKNREGLPANASNEELDAEYAETHRLERLVETERYERIKALIDSTGGMFELDHRLYPPPAIRLIENIKEPLFPTECLDYSQSTPFGLLQQTVGRDSTVNPRDQYINGVSVRIAAESEIFKTDKGWTFR